MKNGLRNLLLAMIATFFSASIALAQAPQAIPFQASARNSSGVILANKTVALRFSVLDGQYNTTALDTVAYQETQNVTTNALGLFMVNIGQGNVLKGTFGSINWGTNVKFIQVEMDTTGSGARYVTIATQQLMSVPYSLNSGNGCPVGTVIANASGNISTGWLLCNGQTVSRKGIYANLFASIGTTYGVGDGSTTFNIPDYRGMFLRGVDAGAGNDPDTASRTAESTGTVVSGGNLGTKQLDAFASHDHFEFTWNANTLTGPVLTTTTSPTVTGINSYQQFNCYRIFPDPNEGARANVFPSSLTGGNETRPKNVYVNYIIKY